VVVGIGGIKERPSKERYGCPSAPKVYTIWTVRERRRIS
jgi:hypothetical protein